MLPQEIPRELAGQVFDVVAGGDGHLGAALADYHAVSRRLARGEGDTQELMIELERTQEALEAGGWDALRTVETIISKLRLDPEAEFATLSGGLKRRTLLGRALAGSPDLLLLDEPTNHLDIESIQWLEEFLLREAGTLVFVTHDRSFLRRLATRIVELDRGRLLDWSCGYDVFLARKEAWLENEAKAWSEFDKKLAREEAWIRQGIKARRTRNEGRVRELKRLREERKARRERLGSVRMVAQEAERSGKLVSEATEVSFAYEGRPIIREFSTTIVRGDRIGVIGPNGSGKTTLLRLLLGELAPDAGQVRLGHRIEVAYFDQMRQGLDEARSVADNIAEGADMIQVGDSRRHVIGYLGDFLFPPERARSPVGLLSGGERNRLLLARLFLRPSNVLVLDEPTNDLDMETLDLLEELLMTYAGTILVVSHDREFLNNVVTGTLALEGEGRVGEYAGGYDDWLAQRPEPEPKPRPEAGPAPKPARPRAEPPPGKPRKLSYKEKRELELARTELAELPLKIEALEARLEARQAELADPELYRQSGEEIARAKAAYEALETELAAAYARWEYLEELLADAPKP
jgi:ATP-binding cassette subfamily F protein uup